MGAPHVITFGCRLNAFESEIMRRHPGNEGGREQVIVNTCAVTREAVRQARQAIRRARREHKDAEIIVTGCAAQIDPGEFAAMAEVDRVLGNDEKLDPGHFGPGAHPDVAVGDIMSARQVAGHLIDGFEGFEGFGDRARAFLQVQNGCDHRCTFCIIPFGRGPSRSVAPGDVVEHAQRLAGQGFREIVITGVDLTAYGADLGGTITLGGLVRRILDAVPGLDRLRLSSLDPAEIDGALMDLVCGEARLMPHLHLSLQSGDDMILKRMKRRHARADAVAFCQAVRHRRPDVAFGADLIAGFPTETEAMFENTLRLIEDCGLSFLHVFPFSARPGTPAAAMKPVPGGLVRERAARLRAAGDRALAGFLGAQVGREVTALMETETAGRTSHYARLAANRACTPGEVVRARITGVEDQVLRGAIL